MDTLSEYLQNLPSGEDLARFSEEELVEELEDHDPAAMQDMPQFENAKTHYGYALAAARAGKKEEAIMHMQHVRQFLDPYPMAYKNLHALRHAAKIAQSLDYADQARFMHIVCGDPNALKVLQIGESISNDLDELYESATPAERRHAEGHVFDPLLVAPQNPNLLAQSVRIAGNMVPLADALEKYAHVHKKRQELFAKIGAASQRSERIPPRSILGPKSKQAITRQTPFFRNKAKEVLSDISDFHTSLPTESLPIAPKEILNRASAVSPQQFRGMTIRQLVLMPQDQWEKTVAGLPESMKKRVPLVEELRVKWRPQLFEEEKENPVMSVINEVKKFA